VAERVLDRSTAPRVYLRAVNLLRCVFLVVTLIAPACGGGTSAPDTVPSAASLQVRFKKAIVRVEDVQFAAKYEAELAQHYTTLAPSNGTWFTVLDGSSRVLVTAGHATAQTREGQLKPADGGTGSLAMMLNRLTHTTTIHTTYASPSDPNYYDDNDFKRAVKKLIEERHPRVVLDLHASHPDHPYDVDFGTMEGRSLLGQTRLLDSLASRLRDEGLGNFSQDFFGASKNQTITKWVSGMGVPTIQCEINSTWLLPAPEVPSSSADAGASTGLNPADEWRNAIQYQRFAELLEGLLRFVSEVDAQH